MWGNSKITSSAAGDKFPGVHACMHAAGIVLFYTL